MLTPVNHILSTSPAPFGTPLAFSSRQHYTSALSRGVKKVIILERKIWLILFVLLGALFILSLWGPISFAQEYQVTVIEPLAGYERSRALGVNNSGQVVGRFYNYDEDADEAIDRQAFIWDSANGARALPTLSGESSAWGINDNGLVSGYSYDGYAEQKAVVWDTTDSDSIIYIGTLDLLDEVAGDNSSCYDLNNLGQVVGQADIPNAALDFVPFHAFLFDETNGIQDLGTLTTSWPEWQNGYSIAYDINENSEAVGIAHDSSWEFHPVITMKPTAYSPFREIPLMKTASGMPWL